MRKQINKMLYRIKFFLHLLFLAILSQQGYGQAQESIFGIAKITILDDSSFVYNNAKMTSNRVFFIQNTKIDSNLAFSPMSGIHKKYSERYHFPINYAVYGRNVFSVQVNEAFCMDLVEPCGPWDATWSPRVYTFTSKDIDSGIFLHDYKKMPFPYRLHFSHASSIPHSLIASSKRAFYDLVIIESKNLMVISLGQEIFVFESEAPCYLDCEVSLYGERGSCIDEWKMIKHYNLERATGHDASNQRDYFRIYIDDSNQIVLAYNNGQSYALDLRKNKLQELDNPSVKDSTLVHDSRSDKYYWIPKLFKMEKFTSPDHVRAFLKSIGQ